MDCTQAKERLQKQSSDTRTKKVMELGRLGFNGGKHDGLLWMCVRGEGNGKGGQIMRTEKAPRTMIREL